MKGQARARAKRAKSPRSSRQSGGVDLAGAFIQKGFSDEEARALANVYLQGTTTVHLPHPATSEDLIQAIIQTRVDELVGAFNRTYAPRLARALRSLRPDGADAARLIDEPTLLRDHSALVGASREIIVDLVRRNPSIRRAEFFKFLREAWPASAGPTAKGRLLFHGGRGFVLAAHGAIMREQNWSCDAACDELAARLRTNSRTIKTHLARARKN